MLSNVMEVIVEVKRQSTKRNPLVKAAILICRVGFVVVRPYRMVGIVFIPRVMVLLGVIS
jgi:hypothetical protein